MSSKESDNLLTFVSKLSGINYRRVEEDLGEGFVRLNVDEAERRQAKHDIRTVEDIVVELIRNSRDAGAKRIFVAFHRRDANKRHIVAIDDGCGIAHSMYERIFESRVTSKLDSLVFDDFGIHGRGMALYSIRSVADRVRIVHSGIGRGTAIEIIVDTDKIPERKDQSTFPTVKVRKGKPVVAKGPHNVPRILLEFSLRYPGTEIYFGSPAQIIATMYALSHCRYSENGSCRETGICFKDSTVMLCECLGPICDIDKLLEAAKEYFGLDISERTGWRILGGKLKSLKSVDSLDHVVDENEISCQDILNQDQSLTKHIPQEELEDLSKGILKNIRELERRYFVKIKGEPKVWKYKDEIRIIIKLEWNED